MDLKPLFDSFYEKFILRDLLARVVPGFVCVFSAILCLVNPDLAKKILEKSSSVTFFILLGASWLVAFALQEIGETLCILRKNPRGAKGTETRETFFHSWARFHSSASVYEEMHAERLNIIRHASGNMAFSILLSTLLAVVGILMNRIDVYRYTPVVAIGVVGFFFFWRTQIVHIERYGRFIVQTIEFHEAEKSGDAKASEKNEARG